MRSGALAAMEAEPDLSTFENKSGLAEDMKFLASMPELCDVTFLVGDTREPVCAVKAVLASRSRVFQKMLYQAPSPQRKKEPAPRENKLRLFLKRSSEPLLNLQNAAQQRSTFAQQLAPIQEPSSQQHQTLIIEEFEPDVFRQLIEYIHTGCVTLQPRTLLGVMNAADYYGLDELRRACAGFVQCCITVDTVCALLASAERYIQYKCVMNAADYYGLDELRRACAGFVQCCITVDTVCALLASAERYIQYKCTKSLVQKVLEFVDEHGNEVLNLGSFTLLPQHVVRLILARDELRADEFTKFQAALMWSKKYCDTNQNMSLKDVIGNFLEYIQFHKIPANVLMREVHPLGLVPYSIIMNALAYQADPASVDPGKLSPARVRRAGRSMSVQSSLDPYGSNTTLSSTGSSDGNSPHPAPEPVPGPSTAPPTAIAPEKPPEKLGLFSSIKRAASKKFGDRRSPTPKTREPRSKSDSIKHAALTRQVSETVAASGDTTFERCKPRKRDSETEFPVRKSTSELSESFPFVRRALAEIENGLNYFRKSITSEPSEPKAPPVRAEPVVVVAAADDDTPSSPPPPMGLKERRGSRGSPCANLPPLMLPPSTPDPSPGRLSPNRLSPQRPKEPTSAPVPTVGQPPRRSRTRSEMPPDPPPRSPPTPRPASVSPKHTFAFKIVLKKVESTPNTSFDRPDQ
ncbi:Serine-enriched protein [Papilio machaon]|uniref:Serine-enriched protein n=1 Tax=Papilio machaon TaxID=76193 RepID=A0A0N1IQ65_PAPMA|nr:Serine-enriched protein [Papilio machaon]